MIGPHRQHLVVAGHRVTRALHLAQGIAAIEQRIGETGPHLQRPVIAGQRLVKAAHILEDIAVVEQRFGHIGAGLQGTPDQVQRFGVAPLLRPHHPQKIQRRKSARRGLQKLEI